MKSPRLRFFGVRRRWIVCVFLGIGTLVSFVVYQKYSDYALQRRFEQARVALEAGNLADVEQAIWALEGDADFAPQRSYLIGGLFVRQGDLPSGLTALKRAAESPELRSAAMILAGRAFYEAGMAGDAQRIWAAVLLDDPDAVDAHRWLGVLYYDLGAMQDALVHFERVSALAPQDPRPHRLMGLINKDYERYPEAVKHYRESMRRDPQQPGYGEVLLELAECHIKVQDHEAALETLSACQDGPRKASLEGECFHHLAKAEAAMEAAERALKYADDFLPALMLKGDLLLDRQDATGAVEVLTKAVNTHPADFHARFKLATALRRVGDQQQADQHAVKADELRKAWQQFYDMHTKAIEQPTNADLRYELGMLAEKIDRADLAENWYRAALAIDGAHEQAKERLESLAAQ